LAKSDPLDHLLTRAATGDRSVLPELLDACRAGMVARLRNRPHPSEAEDVVQEALWRASSKLDTFTWQGWDALQTWLWAFVEHAHADRCKYHAAARRREERRMVAEGTDSSQPGVLAGAVGREETPSRLAVRRERDERLRQAMREVLTSEQQTAIELRFFAFLSVEEVAQRTGWTEGKVKMLCQRGFERLREVLNESMRSSGAS
jgi:RNA polymerase sigma factor (sigma-70 family)